MSFTYLTDIGHFTKFYTNLLKSMSLTIQQYNSTTIYSYFFKTEFINQYQNESYFQR